MTRCFRGTPDGVNFSLIYGSTSRRVDTSRQVEVNYQSVLFKRQLREYVEKIYGFIRYNLKKEISLLLGLSIQVPRPSRASLLKGSSCFVANTNAQGAMIAP